MSERRKPTRGLGVPKDLGYGPSNIEMNELFANIGRAKESVAQSITEQQKKEDERKRSVLNKLFAKKDDAMPGVADTAVDDELAEIGRKLALVRAGELHEYDQASNDSDAPDVVDERTEPAADESAVTNEPDILMDDADLESTDVAMESGPVPEDVPAAAEERTEETSETSEEETERDSEWDEIVLAEDDFSPEQEAELEEELPDTNDVDLKEPVEMAGESTEVVPEPGPEDELELQIEPDMNANEAPGQDVQEAAKQTDEILEGLNADDTVPSVRADVVGYFAVAEGKSGRAGYLYMLNRAHDSHGCAPKVVVTDGKSFQDIVLEGAILMMNDIAAMGCKTAVIHMDETLRELLVNSVSVFGNGERRSAKNAEFARVAVRVSEHCEVNLCDGRQMVARKATQINCESWIRSLVDDDGLWGGDTQLT